MKVSRRTARRIIGAVAVAGVVTVLAAAGLAAGAFAGFQRRAEDALFPSARTDPHVVVVGIDQRSERAIGTYPWPRTVQAQLAAQLARDGATVGVWDVVYGQPSSNPANDTAFAAGLKTLPAAVLAETGRLAPGPDPGLDKLTQRAVPLPELAGAATAVAHAEVLPDPSDGVVRSLPLVVEEPNGTLIPSLSLAAFQALRGQPGPVTIRPTGVVAAGRFIPTEGRHLLRLNWASGLQGDPGHPSLVSAIDVLDGKVGRKQLAGKAVLIGAVDPLLGDHQLVPTNKSSGIPGVFIHANALNTMLTASYLSPVSNLRTDFWVALLALIVALAVMTLPVWASSLLSLLLIAGWIVFAIVDFDAGHLENVFYPLAAIVVAFVGALGVRYATETRRRRHVSALFARYVPEEVARQLEESGTDRIDAAADGERLDVSLFFCDLRGFTSLSATLEPHNVRAMLNEFYELTTEVILGRGGTVMKFVGDEVFAVFGAPLPVEHDPQAALDCAMEIQRRAPELHDQLSHLNIPAIQFGIGMNTGPVVAAHVGGGRRRQYDVVGDTVNLASRLCGQAGRGEIVIPESMLTRLDDVPPHESMGAVQLKGLDDPVPLVRIVVDAAAAAPR